MDYSTTLIKNPKTVSNLNSCSSEDYSQVIPNQLVTNSLSPAQTTHNQIVNPSRSNDNELICQASSKVFTSHKAPQLSAQEYGNKAANLSILASLFHGIEGIEVPAFEGISHAEIQEHLKLHYPKFARDWKIFLAVKGNNPGLNPDAEEQLRVIQTKIEKAFTEHPFSSPATEAFLKAINSALMVRSTGAEDSKEMANAGGNHSEAGVIPNAQDISRALGKVVASYHSPLSIMQRELAGQNISVAPHTPVLIQEMIGEMEMGAIPISGITYSQEILGKTESLTQIQSLYGHNEAAVNSQLPVDTFYVYPDGNCHSIIRIKENRLIAKNRMGFETKENPQHLQKQPSLSEKQVQRIEKASSLIHAHYGMPMDIEWVYCPKRDILYIVQARPLVDRLSMDPETVNLEELKKGMSDVKTQPSEAVVSVQGKVAILTHEDQYITAPTLEEGFKKLTKLAEQQAHGKIKAVIIKEPATGTSHYACTLREMGVDLFVCPEFSSAQPDRCIVIDPQKEILITGQNLSLQPEQFIQKGWFRHPIAAKESLQSLPIPQQQEAEMLAKYLLPEGSLKIQMNATRLKNLLDQLGSDDMKSVEEATRLLLGWIAIAVKGLPVSEESLQLLRNAVRIAKPLLLQKNLSKMQKLHIAKRLQALIMQEATGQIINSTSLLQLIKENKLIKSVSLPNQNLLSEKERNALHLAEVSTVKLMMKQNVPVKARAAFLELADDQATKESLAIYTLASDRCLSPATKQLWMQFSTKIASSRSQAANRLLTHLIRTYEAQGVLDEWLNLSLPQALAGNDNAIETLFSLADNMEKNSKHFTKLLELKKQINHWESIQGQWADPNNFDRLMQQFNQLTESMIQCLDKDFISHDDLLLKSAQMALLKNFIELYDQNIKAMRGSPFYPDKSLQAKNFKTMLEAYLAISAGSVLMIPDSTIETWTSALSQVNSNTQGLKNIHSMQLFAKFNNIQNFNEEQLRPSGSLNVATSVINSCNFPSLEPNAITLEDYFMLAHQNVLAAFDSIFHPPWEKCLPTSLNQLHQNTLKVINENLSLSSYTMPIKANLLSCTHDAKTITLTYNIPIKNHSARLTISYDRKSEKATLAFSMLGHNMNNRMDQIIQNLMLFGLFHDLKFPIPPFYHKQEKRLEAIIELDLTSDSGKVALGVLMQAIKDTFTGLLGSSFINLKSLDQGNPHLWEKLFSSPKKLEQWLGQDLNYNATIIKRLIEAPDLLEKLFTLMGLQLLQSSDCLGVKALKATIHALPQLPAFLQENKNAQKLLVRYLKDEIISKPNNPPEVKSWLIENRELLVNKKNSPLEIQSLVQNLQEKVIIEMINAPNITEEDIAEYFQFLQKQDHSFETTWNAVRIHFIYNKNSPVNQKKDFVLKTAKQIACAQLDPGIYLDSSQIIIEKTLDPAQLQVGDKVICDYQGTYILVQISEISRSNHSLKLSLGDKAILAEDTIPFHPISSSEELNAPHLQERHQ